MGIFASKVRHSLRPQRFNRVGFCRPDGKIADREQRDAYFDDIGKSEHPPADADPL
jgi:hypothetical protein